MAEDTIPKNLTMVVDPSGDVILVVGDTTLGKNIQVSSHVLSLASTVFKAMFSPHFQEGQRIKASSESAVKISLPDDDPEAAGLACKILHHTIDNTLENPNLGLLAKLATFADKYDCVRSLRPSTQRWIHNLQSGTNPAGYYNLLVLSYLFDDPELFQKLTRNMVLEYGGSFQQFVSEHGQEILPVFVARKSILALRAITKLTKVVAIEEKRAKLRARVVSALQDINDSFTRCSHDSTDKEINIAAYSRELYHIQVYPTLLTAGVTTILDRFRNFKSLAVVKCDHVCEIRVDPSEATKKIAAEASSWAEGICLDCVRNAGRQAGKCRIPHT